MTIKDPKSLTKLEIWMPRYSSAYTATRERVALLAKYKVDNATPILLVEFTKAKHLIGQRFAIKRTDAQSYPVDSNGKIDCYAVPMSAFSNWETYDELYQIANNLFGD